ncbi:MAG: hypothetical protein MRJ68_08495 [Nitrospira sp.]|nr:hypothetical protein [Nitrospira sp.]
MIHKWRQRIEDKKSLATGRSPRSVNDQEALQDFRNAILHKNRHFDTAVALLHRLLPSPKSPIIAKRNQDSDADGGEENRWLEAWNQTEGRSLNPKQKSILDDLQAARDRLQGDKTQDPHVVAELRKHFEMVICHAVRNGLENHPWCLEWIALHRNFGDRKALHRLYRTFNLEKGVDRPVKVKKEKTTAQRLLEEIRTLRVTDPALSLRSIHRILQARESYKKPWSTFQKWISDPLRREMIDPSDPIEHEE